MPWITSTPSTTVTTTTACLKFFLTISLHFSSAIANQESLSGLETEMRKLEGIVKEIVDEMDYLKIREERFQNTNGEANFPATCPID